MYKKRSLIIEIFERHEITRKMDNTTKQHEKCKRGVKHP